MGVLVLFGGFVGRKTKPNKPNHISPQNISGG